MSESQDQLAMALALNRQLQREKELLRAQLHAALRAEGHAKARAERAEKRLDAMREPEIEVQVRERTRYVSASDMPAWRFAIRRDLAEAGLL